MAWVEAKSHTLVYSVRQETGWDHTVIEPIGPIGSANISIALDPLGNPHLAYEADLDGSGRTIPRYVYWDGSEWLGDTIGLGDITLIQSGVSLAIDQSGTPHLLFGSEDQGVIYATPVPEPSTYAIVLVGMLCLAVLCLCKPRPDDLCGSLRPTSSVVFSEQTTL